MKTFNPRSRTLFSHIFCWVLFIGYELAFLYYGGGKMGSVFRYTCFYALNISFFYLQIAIFNKVFQVEEKRYLAGVLLVFLLFVVNIFAKMLLSYLLGEMNLSKMSPVQRKFFFTSNIYRMFYFATLAGFYSLAEHVGRYRRQTLIAEKKHLKIEQEKSVVELRLAETRNAYLQQQMNPHLLLNALNYLYTASRKSAPRLSHSVLLLSDMVRFNLEGPEEDGKVLLADEIEQIYNLVEISRRQLSHRLYLDIIVDGKIGGYRIIPLILMTLTENVFKHGNLLDSDHPGKLSIQVDEHGTLTYTSSNLKKAPHGFQRIRSLGIQNIRTRMDFSYSGRYRLDTVESEDYFETNLWVEL